MAVAWPAGFPTPLRDGYGYTDANLLETTQFANGSRERRLFEDASDSFESLSFALSAGQCAEFQGWFKRADGANAGTNWILMPLVAAGTRELREVKISPPNQYRLIAKSHFQVTLRVKTRVGTAPSDEFYDFLMELGGGDAAFKFMDILDYAMNKQIPSFAEKI